MAGEQVKQVYLNHVIEMARVTAEPEVRYIASGKAVMNLRIAVNRRYKDQSGEWKDMSHYFNCVVWGDQAERLKTRLHKGSPVLVTGELASRTWEGKDGKKNTEVYINARTVQDMERHAGAGDATADQREMPSHTGPLPSDEPGGGGGGDPLDDIPFE